VWLEGLSRTPRPRLLRCLNSPGDQSPLVAVRAYAVMTGWGPLNLAASSDGIVGVSLGEPYRKFLRWLTSRGYDVVHGSNDIILDGLSQLNEYFSGVRREFRLPLDLRGTPFQLGIWETVGRIPYGKVWSYRMVAEEAGRPHAYRAAGNAVGENPVMIIIPCHRVVRSDCTLGGYGGREYLKKKLLTLEGSIGKIKIRGTARTLGPRPRLASSSPPSSLMPPRRHRSEGS